MVFNTVLVASVATVSADVWQSIACISERISSDELLDLVICFPLQQLGRFALCVWNFFCVPPPPPEYSYSYYDDDDDESDYDSDASSSGAGRFSGYDRAGLYTCFAQCKYAFQREYALHMLEMVGFVAPS
ncbi:hypothetical protein E3N88_14901 [Mikania micrantha]|uniref:Uncharacterized protein n=1 Tax=Mikania micrantha TaxID=192012 RepID=A0A5N6P4H3_9ASTR|nr:hypothetical protein E3N88_14901 [Mikania micrantha]